MQDDALRSGGPRIDSVTGFDTAFCEDMAAARASIAQPVAGLERTPEEVAANPQPGERALRLTSLQLAVFDSDAAVLQATARCWAAC